MSPISNGGNKGGSGNGSSIGGGIIMEDMNYIEDDIYTVEKCHRIHVWDAVQEKIVVINGEIQINIELVKDNQELLMKQVVEQK